MPQAPGCSMKTRQQQKEDNTETELQALLQQAVAATPLNINNNSTLKKEGKNYSIRRSLSFILPTHASLGMPPKNKTKTSDAAAQSKKAKAPNFTELEDISIYRA
jgi:hypothetical protein